MTEDKNKRLLRYLNDAYATEEGGLTSLRDIVGETTDPEVRAAVTDHIATTHSQVDRLAARIKALGGNTAEAKGMVNTALAKGSQLLNVFHDKEDKRTQDVIKAYSLEHFEVGMYTSLSAYASAVGDNETAQLADSIITEERQAAERFERLIPRLAVAAVNKTSDVGIYGGAQPQRGGRRLKPGVLLGSGAALALALWGVRLLRSGNGSTPPPPERGDDMSRPTGSTSGLDDLSADVPLTSESDRLLSEPGRVTVYHPEPRPQPGTESQP